MEVSKKVTPQVGVQNAFNTPKFGGGTRNVVPFKFVTVWELIATCTIFENSLIQQKLAAFQLKYLYNVAAPTK